MIILENFCDEKKKKNPFPGNNLPSPIAQSVAYKILELEVAGTIPGSENIPTED